MAIRLEVEVALVDGATDSEKHVAQKAGQTWGTGRGLQETWSQNQDSGSSAAPVSSRVFSPESFERERENKRERENYLTDLRSTDLLIHLSKEKMVCAAQFLGVNDPEDIP